MGKEKKYFVNDTLFAFGLIYFVFLTAIAMALLTIGRYFSAIVFALLGLPFLVVAFRYGSLVKVGKDGVELSFLWIKRRSFTWDEINEVLVAGTKVLNRGNEKKCGTLYMIFSKEQMEDEERFQTMLNWPPKDKIYVKFTKDRLMDIQWFYSAPIARYNVGMLDI